MLTYEALPDERQQIIRSLLASKGKVFAAELSARFEVSEHTIRRDLTDLAKAGACRRVYGGAVAIPPDGGSLQHRTELAPERKDALATAAVTLLGDGQCVFLDTGSTNLAIARAIPAQRKLTVVTNSPVIAAALLDKDNVSLIALGGQIDKTLGGTVGVLAVEAIQRLSFDLAFLGACAIDAQEGLTAFSLEDASFKRAVLARSGAVAVAVVNEKLLSVATHGVASVEAISTLVVENDAPAQQVDAFAAQGVQVLVASPRLASPRQ
ncbi:DeoR/GlpR family DNA-binding transcription regulator [Paraburkholderia sp. D15]|uniref:DeoR/GlpR family DNA-binding transcription regulator n=1 Tax=Paraburkholderia sp. D15 TaxID=2880218 RepID=UPI00247887B5|nr:DeoR/GlpR family DNA-binding transcription regulator [Paraburkholderia sp. D15]WGS53853.1 DeoR/GlpR family DNA-binding transcription regulator [Paraburkholderia sp. D15]WKF60615.1 Glucitol operon repressor [Paraburkholderia busanensis]